MKLLRPEFQVNPATPNPSSKNQKEKKKKQQQKNLFGHSKRMSHGHLIKSIVKIT